MDYASGYIRYLTAELDKVSVTDYRAALVDHLAQQEQTRMMASAKNVSFAAQTFSGPSWPMTPSAPKSVLILFFAFIVGCGLGVGAASLADRNNLAKD
jgi:uncharacterized protein involved in exopolysaccharide biosynthesis